MVNFEIVNNLAFYKRGKGPVIFIMPYPHASTYRPVAEGRLADLIVSLGYTMISFDPPGFLNSGRKPKLTMEEMSDSAIECLNFYGITSPIPFIGHSMGGFCLLDFSIRFPEKISKMILIGAVSGWKDIQKYGIHKSFGILRKEFWLFRYYGFRIILGFSNLALQKKLDNLNSCFSFYHKKFFEKIPISKADFHTPAPQRAKWLRMVRGNDLTDKLSQINTAVLIAAGKHDRITPVILAKQLQAKITGSKLEIFEQSGHSPFIEEPDKFGLLINSFFQ